MPSEQEEAERWKKLIEGFKEQIALDTIYFAIPMVSRKTASVLPALQRMVLDVKMLGFPVTRIHGDRAGELRAKQVRRWILGRGILQSYTEGDAPASNGVAEAGVKFIKRRARILLDNAGVDKAHWPDAVRTAAQEQRSAKLGTPSLLAAPFGAKCYVKTKKYKVRAVDDLGPKWMLGRYMGTSADVSGGHVVLKANGQFLQTLNIRMGEEPPRLDDLSPPYFVDEDGLPVPVRRVRHKTKPVTFRTDTEPVGPTFPSSSTAPSPKEAVPGSDTEPVGPTFPSSSTAPSPAERLLIQVQSATVTLKPIRTMIDLVLLRGDLTTEKADTLIASEWSWDQHHGFDVDSVDAYDSLEFHMWSERENIWHGVEEEQDAVFLECPLRLCRSRDGITDAWAKVQKVKRSPDGHRYIFWFVEYDDKGVECQRIWYLQGLEQVRRAIIPYAKLGEDPEVVGDYASATDSDKPSETESVATPEEEVKDELPTGSMKKRPATRTTSSTGASSFFKGPPSARLPPWKRKEGNAKQPPWKKPATSTASLKPIRRTVDTDLMYRFFTAEEAANCMRTQERPGWPDQWNPIDDPMCPAYHLWFQRDAIYSDTQEGYHVRVKFKCFDPETQMDAVRFVGTVIMSYALDNGALFLFFLDTPQDEGRIVGVAGVEVNSTTYISHREMRRTYHQYRGDSMRVLNVDDIEEEVEKVSDWEIYTMDGTSPDVHDQGSGLVASSMPSAEDVEWANLRMMALRMSQCPEHPDEDVEREISELQALLSQPAWSTPRACKAEPEYVDNVEDILANLQEPLRVVYNVSPAEARANLEVWREALAKELGVVSKGFRRVTCEDFRREGLEGNPKVTYVPSKVVYTIKPPDQGMKTNFKRKARIVACGNFSKDEGADLYASGASGETLRCILAEAAHRNWAAGSVDVKGAFMLTPMTDTTTTVVNPPAILVTMGLVDKGEKWILTHAMYGLRQSPRLWSGFRDGHIGQLRGSWNGDEIRFVQAKVEPNLWAIKAGDSICGALLVYVDDLLICGSSSLIEYVAKMIAGLWETTELEVASGSSPVRFLGCEIHDLSPGFSIDQLPYIKELLRSHGTPISQLNLVPCPREWLGGDDDQQVESTPEEVREAQRITGELLWITQRSRPDLAYHVSIMASWATRDPVRVVKIGQRVLGFLQRTAETRLELKPSGEGLSAYTDASFAPTGSRSHTGSLVMLHNCPVAWRSGRQAFTTLSSAESELVALQETYILAQAVQAVMTSFRPPARINLYVDNMAAIFLGTRNEDGAGSWRTRHLKVRSAYVRESVASGDLCLEYVPGSVQLADILTEGGTSATAP